MQLWGESLPVELLKLTTFFEQQISYNKLYPTLIITWIHSCNDVLREDLHDDFEIPLQYSTFYAWKDGMLTNMEVTDEQS